MVKLCVVACCSYLWSPSAEGSQSLCGRPLSPHTQVPFCAFQFILCVCMCTRVCAWLNVAKGDSWLWCAGVNNTVHVSNSRAAELHVCVGGCARVCKEGWGLWWLLGVNPNMDTVSTFISLKLRLKFSGCYPGINLPSICVLWPSCIMHVD